MTKVKVNFFEKGNIYKLYSSASSRRNPLDQHIGWDGGEFNKYKCIRSGFLPNENGRFDGEYNEASDTYTVNGKEYSSAGLTWAR